MLHPDSIVKYEVEKLYFKMKGFKLNSKGMKVEGYKLETGHKVFLYKILVVHENWLFENGYRDGEYIRLSHIMSEERYFDFDKRLLNELRTTWLSNPIMELPF